MDMEALLAEIRVAFPPQEMPSSVDLRFHPEGCIDCDFLAEDLEAFRGKPIDGAAIRCLHQELSSLSARGWAWALPYYLPFCLTPEAQYNQMEIEFLIYSLGPDEQFKADTLKRLSLLSSLQVRCLIQFVQWLKVHPFWSEYFPEELDKALKFLDEIDA